MTLFKFSNLNQSICHHLISHLAIAVADLRVMGRATQGVRLINLRNGDEIAAVAKVDVEDDALMLNSEGMTEGDEMMEEGDDTDTSSSDMDTEETPTED